MSTANCTHAYYSKLVHIMYSFYIQRTADLGAAELGGQSALQGLHQSPACPCLPVPASAPAQ